VGILFDGAQENDWLDRAEAEASDGFVGFDPSSEPHSVEADWRNRQSAALRTTTVSSERQQPESEMGVPGGPAWNVAWSYAVLRFTLGTTFLLHGITRFVSGWSAFADQMVQSFHNTFLPDFMVRPFALSVPPVEAVLGTLLCLGLFTRWTLIAGGLWMVALIFGTTVRQDYPTVAIQLLYALLFFVLQVWAPSNRISLDALMGGRRPQ
jgi:thiosulfate dehydrogenase [quinone] large subunit